LIHSFIHSFVRSFIHSFIHSCTTTDAFTFTGHNAVMPVFRYRVKYQCSSFLAPTTFHAEYRLPPKFLCATAQLLVFYGGNQRRRKRLSPGWLSNVFRTSRRKPRSRRASVPVMVPQQFLHSPTGRHYRLLRTATVAVRMTTSNRRWRRRQRPPR